MTKVNSAAAVPIPETSFSSNCDINNNKMNQLMVSISYL